jgi:general secretion pathway protein G
MRNNPGKRVRRLRREDGYTLTEILVVMGIIGLIAALLTPGLVGQLGRARAKSAQMQLESIASAVETFHSDVNRYPTTAEGLKALLIEPENAEGWTGPYVKNTKLLKDPWGREIEYKADSAGRLFELKSLGRDGASGGAGLDKDLVAPAP